MGLLVLNRVEGAGVGDVVGSTYDVLLGSFPKYNPTVNKNIKMKTLEKTPIVIKKARLRSELFL